LDLPATITCRFHDGTRIRLESSHIEIHDGGRDLLRYKERPNEYSQLLQLEDVV
jgi:hypothetical protein